MRRRQFVTSASATIAAASIAGCSGILGGDGGGNSGPKGAVRAYVDAGKNEDSDAMAEAVHPNGSVSTSPQGGGQFSINSLEVTEESDSEATVVADGEMTIAGQSQPFETTYEVRKHDGEWKVYALQGGM